PQVQGDVEHEPDPASDFALETDEWLGSDFHLVDASESGEDSDLESLQPEQDVWDANSDHDDVEEPSFTTQPEPVKITVYEGAGEPNPADQRQWTGPPKGCNPWTPFESSRDFTLARWFVESNTSKTKINAYFNGGLSGAGTSSFTSGHTLRRQIDSMEPDMAHGSWMTGKADFDGLKETYYYRDPLSVIQYLFRQRAFVNDMIYAPVKVHNQAGERMFSEMHTAEWWWETQVRFRLAFAR
ncbi:MAG: hypothetical protein M1823_006489, partial [Watsoniomyces obsoletus]